MGSQPQTAAFLDCGGAIGQGVSVASTDPWWTSANVINRQDETQAPARPDGPHRGRPHAGPDCPLVYFFSPVLGPFC